MTLLFINLRTLLKKMGMFFYLISLVFIFTSVCLLYIYSFSKSYINDRNYRNEVFRSYIVDYNSDGIEEKIDDFINAHKKDIRRIYATVQNKDGITKANYYGESAAKFKVIYGNRAVEKNEIIVPEKNKNNIFYSIGDGYYLFDREYKITGINLTDTYELVYDSSLNDKNILQSWVIVTEALLKDNKQDDFIADIKELFQTENIVLPETEKVESDTNIAFAIIVLLALLSAINLTFIYHCLLKRRKQQQAVFYILGCSKIKQYRIYIGEMLLITSILYLLCCIFTQFVLFDIMNKVNPIYYLKLGLSEYLMLYFTYTLLIIIILTRKTVMHFKKTPYEMKRR